LAPDDRQTHGCTSRRTALIDGTGGCDEREGHAGGLAAPYDSVSDAEVDYEAVKALDYNAGVGHDVDAAVLERGADGKVKVADKHEASTRHGNWEGLYGDASTPPCSRRSS